MNKPIINLIKSVLTFVTATALIGVPFCTYALDEDCLTSRTYFNNCENMITYNDENGLDGVTRYYLDEREGCFYFYINFHDNAIGADDRIHYRFHISNQIESIKFDVDENGMDANSAVNLKSKVNVIYNFRIDTKNKAGKVVIAFELKDKNYRKLLNSIRCDYYCGNKRNCNLFDNVCLDMRVETTTKAIKTTTLKSTVQKTETKKTTEKSGKSKNTKNADETTKFVPSKRQNTTAENSISHSTKFDAEKHVYEDTDDNTSAVNDEEYWSQVISNNASSSSQQSLVSTRISENRKALVFAAVIAVGAGVGVTIYGISKVNKNYSENDFDEEEE